MIEFGSAFLASGMAGAHGGNAPVWISPPAGWNTGKPPPAATGEYERLTSHLGVRVDRWDGCVWRRRSRHSTDAGVICANQDWPWRASA